MNRTRRPVPDVIESLSSTSDKIRALARAGYLRTEISKLLNIRYQHVRKVLADAGIQEGLQRNAEFERSPVAIPQQDAQPLRTPATVLLKGGFKRLGEWKLLPEGDFELDCKAPIDAGVYAFVVDGFVTYVGLTQIGFRTRMGHYRRGHKRQRTSARVNNLIALTLASEKAVEVLIAVPEPLQWQGLPVVTAAGLEAGLIRMICPEWNLMGTTRRGAEQVSGQSGRL